MLTEWQRLAVLKLGPSLGGAPGNAKPAAALPQCKIVPPVAWQGKGLAGHISARARRGKGTLGQPVDAAIFFQFRRGDRSGSGSNRLLWVHDRGLRKSHAGHGPSIQLAVLACPRSPDAWRSDRRRYSRHIGSYR